ncbi:MAG: hypothetical protein SNJ52_01600 [Verrucomicrobiia bacterium]
MIKIEADTREFEDALIRFQRQTQLGWPEVIRMQARLLVERLIEWTPPFGKNKAAQTKGTRAVESDVRRVFIPFKDVPFLVKEIASQRLEGMSSEKNLDKVKFRDPSIQKLWDKRDWDVLRIIFERSAEAKSRNMRVVRNLDPAEHQKARVGGRVRKGRRPTVVVEKEAALRTYIRAVQKRVGKAKAGWLAAARLVVAKCPAWIGKSGGEMLGRVRDQSNLSDNPSITMSNEVGYASQIFPASKLAQLLSSRVRDMEKNARQFLRAKARSSGL